MTTDLTESPLRTKFSLMQKTLNPAVHLLNKLGTKGMADNILSVYEEARATAPGLVDAGINWYVDSGSKARAITGLDMVKATGIVAALSPQTSWAKNVLNAGTLVSTGDAPTFKTNVRKALRILGGEHPSDVLGGNKVVAFYNNLLDPYASKHVTVDRHAVNIALGGLVGGSAKALEAVGKYDAVAFAYSVAGAKVNLRPCEIQAVTWLAWRTIHASAYAASDPLAA